MARHVDATTQDIGTHKHGHFAAAKTSTSNLRAVAGPGRCGRPWLLVLAFVSSRSSFFTLSLLLQKMMLLLYSPSFKSLRARACFFFVSYQVCLLINALSRFGYGNSNLLRFIENLTGKSADFRWHCGREAECLPVLWQLRYNIQDIVAETHVHHAVGLIQHQVFQAAEVLCRAFASGPSGGRGVAIMMSVPSVSAVFCWFQVLPVPPP